MDIEELKRRIPSGEINFTTSRSGGPGGQNVNKVNSKVELRFKVKKSTALSEIEKERILSILKRRINSEGELIITSQSERTQLGNRKKAVEKFFTLLSKALTQRPYRKPSAPTKASITKRIETKKMRSNIKSLRKGKGSGYDED